MAAGKGWHLGVFLTGRKRWHWEGCTANKMMMFSTSLMMMMIMMMMIYSVGASPRSAAHSFAWLTAAGAASAGGMCTAKSARGWDLVSCGLCVSRDRSSGVNEQEAVHMWRNHGKCPTGGKLLGGMCRASLHKAGSHCTS